MFCVEAFQCMKKNRRRRESVNVVVTENHYSLVLSDSLHDAIDRLLHIVHEKRIVELGPFIDVEKFFLFFLRVEPAIF